MYYVCFFFFFQAEDGIRDVAVTGVQTCALPILADARFDGVPRPVHFESHTSQACAPLHPPDCALCRFITTPAQAGTVTIIQAGQPESRWPTPTTHNTQRSAWFTRQALPRAPPTLS